MISVDPSSPFTQGALLGDRIRLADHFLDPGVFIRSMGTRGHLGGLAEATLQALLVLDAAGKDLVFLETVGTGQSEVGVISIADTVVLVLMPGSGDSIQALKAGIMEIPDVIVVNKLDHPLAETMANEVRQVLALGRRASGGRRSCSPRRCAARASTELWEKIEEHRAHLEAAGAARGAAAAEPRGARCSRSPRRGRAATSSTRSPTTPSCGGCSTRSAPRARPADAPSSEILGRCFQRLTTTKTARRSLTSRPRASGSAGIARVTPVYGSETLSRADRPRRVVLKAENLQRTGSFKIRGAVEHGSRGSRRGRARRRRDRGERRQPRPGGRLGGARARHPRDDLHARRTRRWRRSSRRRTTAARRCSSARASTRRSRTRCARVERDRRDVRPRVRGRARDRRPGDDRARARRAGAGRRDGVVPVGGGGLASGIAIALRALRPERRGSSACAGARGGRLHDRRRDRRQAARRADDGASSASCSTTSSTVSDDEISEAITLLLERSKLVVEGAGAVGVAALLAGKVGGQRPGVRAPLRRQHRPDAADLGDAARPHARRAGTSSIRTRLPDRPGELIKLLAADRRASAGNLVSVDHQREGVDARRSATPASSSRSSSRNEEHCLTIIAALEADGFPVERIR